MIMLRKSSILSLLLALTLTVAALTPGAAAASGGLKLVCSSTEEQASQTVGFTGVPDQCQSLQATFTLSQPDANYTFAADETLASLPGVHTTWQQNQADVTVYVTLRTGVLTKDGALTLGTLSTADTPFTVNGFSGVKLLGARGLELTVSGGNQDDGSNSGSGSGSVSGGAGGAGSTASWAVEVAGTEGGTVTASAAQAASGKVITLTAVADSGYALESISAAAGGKDLALTAVGNGMYTFTMPAAKVTVTAVFALQSETVRPFIDVAPGVWYDEAVQYVYENSLMSGTGEGRFSPDVTTSRAMIVTILYRLEGSPAVNGGAAFTDVEAGTWYTDAVAWASANGIVSGYGEGKFGPNDPITREQMAAILYRYAGYKGLDVSGRADLSGFTDAGQISAYAVDTLRWAVSEELITGTSATTLTPGGSATRAQAALILMRLCQMEQN